MDNDKLQLFEDQPIRIAWDEEREEWLFSIVDVVRILTDQPDLRHASTYWAVLKKRMKKEGADQLLTNCKQLKLKSFRLLRIFPSAFLHVFSTVSGDDSPKSSIMSS